MFGECAWNCKLTSITGIHHSQRMVNFRINAVHRTFGVYYKLCIQDCYNKPYKGSTNYGTKLRTIYFTKNLKLDTTET